MDLTGSCRPDEHPRSSSGAQPQPQPQPKSGRKALWVLPGTLVCLLLVWAVAIGPSRSSRSSAPPSAKNGVLDLRSWDFTSNGVVPMLGEWVFSSGSGRHIRAVPDQWRGTDASAERGMGYGTYHLRVFLPLDAPPLALRVRTMATALEVRVNGHPLGRAGTPSRDPLEAVAAYKPQVIVIPAEAGPTGAGAVATGGNAPGAGRILDFAVSVSNWEYRTGGMWEPLELGERTSVFEIKQRADDSAYLLYIFFLCIAGIGITVFLLRAKEKAFLFFGLFCVAMALRVFSTGEYLITRRFPGLNFETVIRLEYLSFLLAVPLGFLFFYSFYPYLAGKRLKVILLSPYALFLVALPFLPLPFLTGTIFVLYGIIFSGLFVMALLLLIRVLPRQKSEGAVVIAGGFMLGIATINDSLHSSYVIQSADIVPLVLAIFIGVLAVILARRLLISFGRAELLGEQLSVANARLSRELENTHAARVALEDALKDRETLIHEIHHRVKNSLQIVASIISLQTRRISDAATRSMFQRLNLRIRSISLVHEKLYDVSSVTHIEINGYIQELVHMLESAYAREDTRIRLTLPAEELTASLEFCIDLGLILNELVSNAFKHGPRSGSCTINIEHRDTSLEVTVRNPLRSNKPAFGADKDEGLGFKILRTVLKRSDGTFTSGNAAGEAIATLSIPWEESEVSQVSE